jgi:hypothetical protein
MRNGKTKKRPYNLSHQNLYEVAARIAGEVIRSGRSTGWWETEPGEAAELARILRNFNIEQTRPGDWELNLPGLAVLGELDMGGLNQAVTTLNHFAQQANQAYALGLLSQLIYARTADDLTTVGDWFVGVGRQIADKLNLPLSAGEGLTKVALLQLAGIPDRVTVPFDKQTMLLPLVKLARLTQSGGGGYPPVKALADLPGSYLVTTRSGQERCLVVTLDDDEVINVEVFDGHGAALRAEPEPASAKPPLREGAQSEAPSGQDEAGDEWLAGELLDMATINLDTGQIENVSLVLSVEVFQDWAKKGGMHES